MKQKILIICALIAMNISAQPTSDTPNSILIQSIDLMNKEIILGGESNVIDNNEENEENEENQKNYLIDLQTSDINKLNVLIEQNEQALNTVIYEGNTLAHLLLMRKNSVYHSIILEHIDIINWNQYNQKGETIFHQIFRSNDLEFFQKIRESFSSKEWKKLLSKNTRKNQTPLHLIALNNHNIQILHEILKESIDLEIKDKDKNQTFAHYLSALGKKEMLLMALKNGSSVETKDFYGHSLEYYIMNYQSILSMREFYPYFSSVQKIEALDRMNKAGIHLHQIS